MSNYDKATQLFESIGLKKGLSSCYLNIGLVNANLGNYAKSIAFTEKAAKVTIQSGDKRTEAHAYNNIGINYFQLGNYVEALKYYHKSLHLREVIKDELGIAASYSNIGILLYEQNKWEEALLYQKKALKIKNAQGDKKGIAYEYSAIAKIYTKEKKYKTALDYLLKSVELSLETGDRANLVDCYYNIGNNYFVQNKINEALSYYLKGLAQSNIIEDKVSMINNTNGIGTCYEYKRNYEQAVKYYSSSFALSQSSNYKQGLSDASKNLAATFEKLKKYEQALKYSKLHTTLKDSLLNEESVRQTAELNTRYETEKKESEIKLLTKDQQLKDKSLKEQRLVRIGLIIGLGLFLAVSFLLFTRYRFKQKANVVLEKQKEEIHQKNVLITDSIDYAKNIQEAILPDEERLTTYLPKHFILYKPKAIVSGDFYWVGKKGNDIICVVADCTGHGVPGAFMSLLGHNILENVIQRDTSIHPGAILTTLNEEIVFRFTKGKELETVKHGMDIAIISMDETFHQLNYAGARNSLYIVRDKKLIEIKANKMSTGIVAADHSFVQYENHSCALQKGDMLYLFSDGFPDQKGGPDKKKFYYQPFKDLLTEISVLPVDEQQLQLDETITKWIGTGEQIDDILVMGIKISTENV